MTEKFRGLLQNHQFAAHNNIRVTDIDVDSAEGVLDVTEQMKNVFGMVHGGAFYALADVISAMAVRSDGLRYVTQSADVHYMGASKEDRLYCRCSVVRRTSKTAVVEAKIRDETEKPLFLGVFTFFRIESQGSIG